MALPLIGRWDPCHLSSFLHLGSGLSWCYAPFLRYIEPDRPVYGIQARQYSADDSNRPQTIESTIVDYTDDILRLQPTGSYHLAGWFLVDTSLMRSLVCCNGEGSSAAAHEDENSG